MIADYLHRNPRLLALTIAFIVVAGISSFLVMPRLEDPVLGRRVGVISTVFPGANAERVESLVTVVIEERLNGIASIRQVRSNSQNSISNIVVELDDTVYDVDPVWSIVRSNIADAFAELPDSCGKPDLQVVPLKAFAAIVAVQAVDANGDEGLVVSRRLAKKLRTELVAISGTEQVDIFGDPGEEFLVEIEPTTLASTGLSTAAIAAQIVGNQADLPAGRIAQQGGDLALELSNAEQPIDRISDSLITSGANGKTVALSEIATITRQLIRPHATEAIISGRPAIVLGAMVDDRLRVDLWADQLETTLADFQSQFADQVTVELLFSQRQHIDHRMQMLFQNLGMGTAAVMLVVLVMMGWRSMIVVAMALPLSACMVLAAMRMMAIPVHQMSVTGLIVALGLLIDNAIVIVEDVRSRILSGSIRSAAIVDGVKHLRMPLFGSTLTTVFAFLPIATLPGPPGEFVGTIATSVILAICASFGLALTVIPAMVGLLKIDASQTGGLSSGLSIESVRRLYESSLVLVFRSPLLGIALGTLLPLSGFYLAGQLPEQFFPPSDRTQIQMEVELPARDGIQSTKATVEQIRTIVDGFDQIDSQYWFLGGSAPTFFYNVVPRRRGTPFYAQAFADLNSGADVGGLVRRLQSAIDTAVPQARVIVRQLEQGPPFDAPVEVRILGEDPGTLQRLGSALRVVLTETSNVIHTRSDFEETIPRLQLQVDERAARKGGLNKSQLAGLLYTTVEGASAGRLFDGDEDVPVRVKLRLDGSFKLERLAALPLPAMSRPAASGGNGPPSGPPQGPPASSSGLNPLTLSSIATWELDSDVGAIVRIDGRRANEVKAYVPAGVLPSTVIAEFKRRLADSQFSLPAGYAIEFGGETEQRTQAVAKLIANGFVLFALMLLTLVASFRSFRCAFVIAAVGGLSAGLGPLALAWFGYPFGFMAIVGTMGLVGVAINDSIVVLAAIRANVAARGGDRAAVAAEVSHCTRHVIATTLTTIVGFLPLILGGGGFWPPLAITIAGGVAGATFLALYFTPTLYLLLCGRSPNDSVKELAFQHSEVN